MRTAVVVVIAPGFDGCAGLGEAQEDMLVKALVAQAAIERFNEMHSGPACRAQSSVTRCDRRAQLRDAGQLQPVSLTIRMRHW